MSGQNQDLTMLIVGDVRINREDPPSVLEHVGGLLREADFTLGNLEGAMADKGKAWDKAGQAANWGSGAKQVAAIEYAKFDAVNVANNHMMDYGHEALLETIGHLDRIGVKHTGGGRNLAEARIPAIVEKHGCRVALVGYTCLYIPGWEARKDQPGLAVLRGRTSYEPGPRFLEGPGKPPIIHSWIVPEDKALLAEQIAVARKQADIVVCTFHWGVSGGFIDLTEYQPDLGRFAIDAGADIVFGHHPHVVQGVEMHKGKPIFYSLGNFVFDAEHESPSHGLEKMMVRCRIHDKKIKDVDILPMWDHETKPRLLDRKDWPKVIDVVKKRSKEFGTRFEETGDAVRVLTG